MVFTIKTEEGKIIFTEEHPPTSGDKLYKALLDQYSQVKARNDAIISSAQNLMGFAGIINTILLGVIAAVTTNSDVKTILSASSFFILIEILIILGFILYVLSIYQAFNAYKVSLYMPPLQLNSKNFIKSVFNDRTAWSDEKMALQINKAIMCYNDDNERRYMFLSRANKLLSLAIGATAILGIILILAFITF